MTIHQNKSDPASKVLRHCLGKPDSLF